MGKATAHKKANDKNKKQWSDHNTDHKPFDKKKKQITHARTQ